MKYLKMKTSAPFYLFILTFALTFISCSNEKVLTSPDGQLELTCEINADQIAVYSIAKNSEVIIRPSQLGIEMDRIKFTKALNLVAKSEITLVNENYEMLQGKKRDRKYRANQQTFSFKNAEGHEMQVIFRVSNDGVAFRYHFPEKSDVLHKIINESTSFSFTPETKAWMQPMSVAKTGWSRTNPSYEENYLEGISAGTASPLGQGWVFPALLQTGENWVLLSETALDRTYCASRLKAHPDASYQIGFPEDVEHFPGGNVYPESTLPWITPWRVLTIGSLKTITESTLETDLANAPSEQDFSWVKMGKSSWSWVLLKDDSTVFDVQKKYIDYAADMNWDYCLVDADWDRKIGEEKLQVLVDHAKNKGVGVNVWYNSSGDWNDSPYTPKSKLLTAEMRDAEFSKLQKIGVTGVKVDFFGGDGQSVINYYIDLMEAAAKHHLMINFHGCTYPRSWHRTYPNLATMESIKGMEFSTFFQENADKIPAHGNMLCYTRNACSPMDFTPMSLHWFPQQRRATNAFELATSVLFLSGIQHYAERPEGVAAQPLEVKRLLQNIPALWDETVFVDGYPGKLTVIARRTGDTWYVAGINGENINKDLELDLSFIPQSNASVFQESDNPLVLAAQQLQYNTSKPIAISLKGHGGFLIKFD